MGMLQKHNDKWKTTRQNGIYRIPFLPTSRFITVINYGVVEREGNWEDVLKELQL